MTQLGELQGLPILKSKRVFFFFAFLLLVLDFGKMYTEGRRFVLNGEERKLGFPTTEGEEEEERRGRFKIHFHLHIYVPHAHGSIFSHRDDLSLVRAPGKVGYAGCMSKARGNELLRF